MGVRGLTTLLETRGIFPPSSSSQQNYNLSESPYYKSIPPHSTFSIDGAGLAFYIYERSYKQYYHAFLAAHPHMAVMDVIRHLLPSFLPLTYLQSYTQHMMTSLLQRHKVNVTVWWDGHIKRMKNTTMKSRKSQRCTQSKTLERFLSLHILPKSFVTRKKGVKVPPPHVFLEEFPMPLLTMSQIRHTLEYMEISLSFSSSDDEKSCLLQSVHCDEEADRDVALASLLDVSNSTYAVGADSDYCIYGFSSSSSGDNNNHVLYAPLPHLQWENSDKLGGIVITRKDIAQALYLPCEELLIEASILLGNDYTYEFIAQQNPKSCNFFQEFGNESSSNNSMKEKISMDDIIYYLSQMEQEYGSGSSSKCYKVTTTKSNFQLAIQFTRDLYSFGDISSYPFENDDDEEEEKEEDTITTIHPPIQMNNDIFNLTNTTKFRFQQTIQSKVQDMVEDDASWDTFKNQILAPFEHHTNIQYYKYFYVLLHVMQQHLQNQPAENEQNKFFRLPEEFTWKYEQLSHLLQKSISVASKARSKHGVMAHTDISPATIFHPIVFHRVMVALHARLAAAETTTPPTSSSAGRVGEEKEERNNNMDEEDAQHNSAAQEPPSLNELPIDAHKDVILTSVQNNRVTIIQGETGCGKSSKVPIMLLETPPPDPTFKEVRMFICQPRRIAAKSLTERIKSTHPQYKHLFGLRMGHGVREETKDTRVWFATTGYLVRLLANYPERFDDCTHLVIDEVHERSVETDVLCLLARRLLERNKRIRLILMSATVAAGMYRDYFQVKESPLFVGVRCFPIQEYYLEDVVTLLQLSPKEMMRMNEISRKITNSRCKMVPNANDRTAIHDLAVQLAAVVSTIGSSVLIFVPGMADIINIMELFDNVVCHDKSFTCIPIHSDVPFEDQMTAFDSPEKGKVKIIIATNAAESSVTLPDVDHVICLGLCKQISYNPQSHRQILDSTWISRASATQRAGRTGRVRSGNVYRLYPRVTFEKHMLPFEEGEILRTPLDSVILNLRTITDDESITELLMDCLEPPSLWNVDRALRSLHECNFISDPSDDFSITPLGSFVIALGVDLALGSFIGYGIRMGVGPEAIDVVAALSSPKSPWLIPNALLQEPDKYNDIVSTTYVSKGHFDAHLFSEPMAISNLLWDFDHLHQDSGNAFCRKFGVHYARLKYISSTRNSLRLRVAKALGVESESLVIEKPPRKTCKKKIAMLRAIHVWLFHDCIIRLTAHDYLMQGNVDSDGKVNFKIDLKGDLIEEEHLSQVLDSSQHNFSLDTNCSAVFHVAYRLEEIDYRPYVIEDDEFERRLLSLALENKISCVLFADSGTLNLYIRSENMNEVDDHIDNVLDFDATFACHKANGSNQRGWRERDCGAWTCEMVDGFYSSNHMIKFSCSSGSKRNRQKLFTRLRKVLESKCAFSALCINLNKVHVIGKAGILTMFTYRSTYSPTAILMADLLGTTQHKVTFSGQAEQKSIQSIVFNTNESEHADYCLLDNKNAPEGARVFMAASSGYSRSRKAVVYLKKDTSKNKRADNNTYDESDALYLEVFPEIIKTQARWTHAATGNFIFLDATNFPASVCPMDEMEIFACCGNTLELSGGGYRVESLTLLPPGTSFAGLAMACIGMDAPYGAVLPEYHDQLEMAEAFHELMMAPTGDHLGYSPELSRMFAQIFAPFIDETAEYESDDSPDTFMEEKKTCVEKGNDRDASSFVSSIAGRIGAEYMPTSFLALASSGGGDNGDNSPLNPKAKTYRPTM